MIFMGKSLALRPGGGIVHGIRRDGNTLLPVLGIAAVAIRS
jgi:hypothetical protein